MYSDDESSTVHGGVSSNCSGLASIRLGRIEQGEAKGIADCHHSRPSLTAQTRVSVPHRPRLQQQLRKYGRNNVAQTLLSVLWQQAGCELISAHDDSARLPIFFVTTFPGGVSCVNISSAARRTCLWNSRSPARPTMRPMSLPSKVIARGGRTDSVAAGDAERISVGTPRASISRAMLPIERWQVSGQPAVRITSFVFERSTLSAISGNVVSYSSRRRVVNP